MKWSSYRQWEHAVKSKLNYRLVKYILKSWDEITVVSDQWLMVLRLLLTDQTAVQYQCFLTDLNKTPTNNVSARCTITAQHIRRLALMHYTNSRLQYESLGIISYRNRVIANMAISGPQYDLWWKRFSLTVSPATYLNLVQIANDHQWLMVNFCTSKNSSMLRNDIAKLWCVMANQPKNLFWLKAVFPYCKSRPHPIWYINVWCSFCNCYIPLYYDMTSQNCNISKKFPQK